MSEEDTTLEQAEEQAEQDAEQNAQEHMSNMFAALTEWQGKLQEVAEAKRVLNEERELRRKVTGLFFVDPEEGTQRYNLPQDWKLKYVHKIERKVDETALPAVSTQLREQGYKPELMIKWVPVLNMEAYRKLPPEAMKILDQALDIKVGSPTLELEPPKADK